MITSKQRAYLRGLANPIDTIIQIGKAGIGETLITQVDEALEARELIKLRVLETAPVTAREACDALTEALGAEPVQVIGTKIVLYRKSKDNPRIDIGLR